MTADPSLMLQTALRARLVAFPDLVALVPASAIFDRLRRPEGAVCIVMGEGQTIPEEAYLSRNMVRVALDLHLWAKADAVAPVKAIAGALAGALSGDRPALDGARCVDFRTTHTRFMRDPGNEWAHGVVTVEALVELPL